MKRMYAPKHWYLEKLAGPYATRPGTGPHKLRECIPVGVLLRNRLKYALNNQETIKICKDKEGLVKVDNRIRRSHKFPLGFQDVVSFDKTGEFFRILIDVKGRFQPHRVDEKEGSFKLLKVKRKSIGKNKIPFIVTHDGRTIRFPHPDIKKNDTIKFNLITGEIDGLVKFENGCSVMTHGGNNIGRVGILSHVEHHPGSYEIANIRDSRGNIFATRLSNVMVIGEGKKPLISLPKAKGIKLSLIEERDQRFARTAEDEDDE